MLTIQCFSRNGELRYRIIYADTKQPYSADSWPTLYWAQMTLNRLTASA